MYLAHRAWTPEPGKGEEFYWRVLPDGKMKTIKPPRHLRCAPDMHLLTTGYIQRRNEEAGYKFFHPSNMRACKTRVLEKVYAGPGGIYFVTSDMYGFLMDYRGYNVRKFDPLTGRVIVTVGNCKCLASKTIAQRAAASLAKGDVTQGGDIICPKCGGALQENGELLTAF